MNQIRKTNYKIKKINLSNGLQLKNCFKGKIKANC